MRNPIKQLFCSHEWTRAESYIDIFYDVCNKCWREIGKQINNQEKRIKRLEKEILGTKKMAKQRWYVITYQDKKEPEEVIGFRQALAFRRKKDAEKEYKKSDYKKPKRKIRRIYF